VLSYGFIHKCLAYRHLPASGKSAIKGMGNQSTTCLRHKRLEAEYFLYHPCRLGLTAMEYCFSRLPPSEVCAVSGRGKKGKQDQQQMHEDFAQALQKMEHGFTPRQKYRQITIAHVR